MEVGYYVSVGKEKQCQLSLSQAEKDRSWWEGMKEKSDQDRLFRFLISLCQRHF